jgi:hypothetical protein
MSSVRPTPESSANATSATGFATLARRISVLTTNLLATGIVLVGGLALGWQVLAWWQEDVPANPAVSSAGGNALRGVPDSPFESAQELWTKAGPLKVERLSGDRAAALAAMRAWCLEGDVLVTAGEAGPGEQAFLQRLADETPALERGDIAVYVPKGEPTMVVTVSRSRERIVAWSFALQSSRHAPRAVSDDGTRSVPTTSWTLYHFRPATPGAVMDIPNSSGEPTR